jgi:hypothetical protein
MMHKILNISTAKSYVPYQMLENKQMLYQFLQDPDNFLHHIRRYSNALTTTMVFGWRTPTYEDEKMKQLFDGFSEFAVLNQTGTAAIVDFFPILRRLPEFLFPAKRKAKILHQHEKALYLSHWLNAKKSIEAGTIPPCFCIGVAEAQKKDGFTDDEACYISGTLLEAGSDTTSSTLYAFIQAMLLYPEVQKQAQAEIDRVIGSKRLPTMEDEHDLPFIRCCVKETLRWRPTTILGAVPHAANQDDIYMGYVIPKGAAVMNNVWSVNMDPSRYTDPHKFDPKRFENNTKSLYDSAVDPDVTMRDQFTFGAGRRICPGIHVAERSLFLGMSRLLWAFNVMPELNKDGSPNIPDPEKLTQGFVCMPEKFRAKITVRSKERADLVTREWREAEEEFLDPQTKQWAKIPDEVRNAISG